MRRSFLDSSSEDSSESSNSLNRLKRPNSLIEESVSKRVHINSSVTDYDSSSENSSESLQIYEENDFYPTNIERQVIRMALSMIRRANMYDWDMDNSPDDANVLCLRETQNVFNPDTGNNISCDIDIIVRCNCDVTICEISYIIERKTHIILIEWETSNMGSEWLHISQDVVRNTLFFFPQTITEECNIFARDCRELAWCYFIDARYHLNRICP